jgi:hypothetical protein
MIKMEIKILIKNVIINESDNLSIFLEGKNSQILFNMYFHYYQSGCNLLH